MNLCAIVVGCAPMQARKVGAKNIGAMDEQGRAQRTLVQRTSSTNGQVRASSENIGAKDFL